MYWDTDSVILIQKDNDRTKVNRADFLGDFTDELQEYGSCSFVDEFVSSAPKNLAFSVFCLSTGKRARKCKVKGITLRFENSKAVHFTIFRDMILENAPPVHVHNPRKIKRQNSRVMVSEPERKVYKVVLKKRRLMGKCDFFPYGY